MYDGAPNGKGSQKMAFSFARGAAPMPGGKIEEEMEQLIDIGPNSAASCWRVRQFGQYQGAAVFTGFGLRFRHTAQR
jgi:hypothetical protein